MPSTGTVKRILAREGLGTMCQVCWRGRWFRAHVMQVYSTSLLLGWHDWPDSDWPNFFIRVALAAAPKTPPDPERDETWRIRWCVDTPTRDLPIVEPRFAELPPLNWVKAFLRCYASTDETQLLREIQSHLPRELIGHEFADTCVEQMGRRKGYPCAPDRRCPSSGLALLAPIACDIAPPVP